MPGLDPAPVGGALYFLGIVTGHCSEEAKARGTSPDEYARACMLIHLYACMCGCIRAVPDSAKHVVYMRVSHVYAGMFCMCKYVLYMQASCVFASMLCMHSNRDE